MNRNFYTLSDIADAMREHDRHETPGSESGQWQEFCGEARRCYGVEPFDDEANEIAVSAGFAGYWLAIADGDYDRYALHGDAPDK